MCDNAVSDITVAHLIIIENLQRREPRGWIKEVNASMRTFPGNIPGTHFCQTLSRPQGHSAAGRIMSMENFSDTIGNRNRELQACSAVAQTTAPPCLPPHPTSTSLYEGD